MEDEAQAEAETDTEAPSDICRLHPILRSRAGSQLLLLLPPGLREAKQKADRAVWNAKSNAKSNLNVARVQRAKWIQGPFGLERTFGTAACTSADAQVCAGRMAPSLARLPSRARASTRTVGRILASRETVALRLRLSSVRSRSKRRRNADTR
jgi:hypothetical protein